MSTIKVSNIQNASASSAAITLDANGQATLNGLNYPTAGPLSNRNLIINGAMQVAQRGTTSTATGYATVDRFACFFTGGAVTQTQEALASGSPYNEGFRSFLRLTNTTSGTAAGDLRLIHHYIEAQNVANSGWNYASASSYVTLSFWVRASVGQDYAFYVRSSDGTAQAYSFTFTLAADTWTKVTHTVPGAAAIAINNDNGIGLQLTCAPWLGTDYTDSGHTHEAWAAVDGTSITTDMTTTWASTTNATFDYTGIQLEVGSVATPFEHRSYGDELARCQRYCQTLGGAEYSQILLVAYKSAVRVEGAIKHVVQMRTGPSVSTTGTGNFTADKGGSTFATDLVYQSVITAETNQDVTFVDFSPGTSVSGSDGQCGFLYNNASSTRKLILSAEL